MAHPGKSDKRLQSQTQREQRRARLAAELRANLLKRKEQARAREPQDAAASGGEEAKPDAGAGLPGEVA